MESDDGSIFYGNELNEARCSKDIRLSVARKVVFDRAYLVTVLFACLLLGQANRGDFGFAEGYAWNSGLVHHRGGEAGDFFRYEDALQEATVCKLKSGNDVSDCVDVAHTGVQSLIGENEAALHLDTGFFVAQAFGHGTASNCNQENIGIEGLAIFCCDVNAGVILCRAGEAGIGVESNAALTERTLEVLGNGLVFVICKVGERFDDCDFRTEGTPDGSEL